MPKSNALAERLRAYVTANRRKIGVACYTCSLPAELREAITIEHENGGPLLVISAFLKTEGHKISESALGKHFRAHHAKKH